MDDPPARGKSGCTGLHGKFGAGRGTTLPRQTARVGAGSQVRPYSSATRVSSARRAIPSFS